MAQALPSTEIMSVLLYRHPHTETVTHMTFLSVGRTSEWAAAHPPAHIFIEAVTFALPFHTLSRLPVTSELQGDATCCSRPFYFSCEPNEPLRASFLAPGSQLRLVPSEIVSLWMRLQEERGSNRYSVQQKTITWKSEREKKNKNKIHLRGKQMQDYGGRLHGRQGYEGDINDWRVFPTTRRGSRKETGNVRKSHAK